MVSATFLNREEGIYQHVSIFDSPYANGIWEIGHLWKGVPDSVNPNTRTISIETEGKPGKPISPKQYRQLIDLLVDIASFYPQFRVYTAHVNLIGHYEISPHHRPNCPGPHFDFPQIARDANERISGVVVPEPSKIVVPGDPRNNDDDLWVNTLYVVTATAGLKVREAPTSKSPQANRQGVPVLLTYGQEIQIDVIKKLGESVNGNPQWGHLEDESGFISLAYARPKD